jgi:hypothetical protein
MTAVNQILSSDGMAVALKLELIEDTVPPPPPWSIAIDAFVIALGTYRVELREPACGPVREAAHTEVATKP